MSSRIATPPPGGDSPAPGGRSLSVIVPAFNEALRIRQSLTEICAALQPAAFDWEIRVVDDGSTDATREIVAAASAAERRIVLQPEPHRGKGGAVRAGMLAARSQFRFLCDADLSMPMRELPRFLALVPSECDIAIGTREGVGARRVGEPWFRHTLGRGFNSLTRGLLLPDLQDTQCGFKLFTAASAEAVFAHVTLDGWAFDIEALFIARRVGLRVQPLAIEWHYREQSRVRPGRDAVLMACDVLRVRFRGWSGVYPAGASGPSAGFGQPP